MLKFFFIVDGNSFMHRSYNAIPPLKNKNGFITNALTGTLNMVNSLINKFNPDNLVVAFDIGGSKYRKELFVDYKANRNKMEDDLRKQFPVVKKCLKEMGIKLLEIKDVEADDSMSALAKKVSEMGYIAVLVTSDKDLRQMVSENILMLDTKEADKNPEPYGIEGVFEREGVYPNKMIEKLSLMGDKADNIPGIEGIGDKTAVKLINKYGHADLIFDNLEQEKGALKERLTNGKENYFLSKKLVTIDTNIDLNVEDYIQTEINKEELAFLLNDYGLKGLIKSLKLQDQIDLLKEDVNCEIKHFDLNKIKKENIYLYYNKDNIFINQSDNIVYEVDESNFLNLINHIKNQNIKIITFQVKDIIKDFSINSNFEDIELLNYIIKGGRNKEKVLEDIYEEYLKNTINIENDYQKALIIKEIYQEQVKIIKSENLSKYQNFENKTINILSLMEKKGILLDKEYLKKIESELTIKLENLENKIFEIAGNKFNINSPKQVSKVLFEDLQIPSKKKSTAEDILKLLKEDNLIVQFILEFRSLSKLKSTFVVSLQNHADENNIVRTNYNQVITNTGRLSSNDPNLQNIPIRTEEGRKIRKAFIARKGYKLVAFDYSQIEIRILANLSQEETLINAFKNNIDIHTLTASQLFNVTIEDVSTEQRRIGKTINFGLIYGQSGRRMAEELGIEVKYANKYKKDFFKNYEKIKPYFEKELEFAKENQYVLTENKRVINIPDIRSSNSFVRSHAEKAANNASIQGTASDIIKQAMIDVYNFIFRNNFNANILLQVHDELVIEIEELEVEKLSKEIQNIMQNCYEMSVPLEVEYKIADNWLDAH
jgi:DNA polymerase-1